MILKLQVSRNNTTGGAAYSADNPPPKKAVGTVHTKPA